MQSLFLAKISPLYALPPLPALLPPLLSSSVHSFSFSKAASLWPQKKCAHSSNSQSSLGIAISPCTSLHETALVSSSFHSHKLSFATTLFLAACNQVPAPTIHWIGLLKVTRELRMANSSPLFSGLNFCSTLNCCPLWKCCDLLGVLTKQFAGMSS